MKFIVIVLLAFSALAASAEVSLPAGCKLLTISDETIRLSDEKPKLMMFHNMSETDVWVTHPVSDPGASAGWSSRLQAGKWSALVLDKKIFKLSCIESRPGHEQQVPCKSVLSVCELSGVLIPADRQNGNYWAGEDMSLSSLTTHIGSRGFALPASGQK